MQKIRERPIRVGIVGVRGYGGGELLRLCATHPHFSLVYVAGEESVGKNVGDLFPGAPAHIINLTVQKWQPKQAVKQVDLLFLSLPTGKSKKAVVGIPEDVRIVDLGGDHRFAEGWTYGLANIQPELIRKSRRIANPGCYPTAALTAIAPLIEKQLINPRSIKISALSGMSGMGRGAKDSSGFAELNEDAFAYGFFNHPHLPEIENALREIGGSDVSVTFVPQCVPMTRGILATCLLEGKASTDQCFDAARRYYLARPFVRVVTGPIHTKHATGSNLVFVSYVADRERRSIVALAAIDNLGAGAAGQAIQNGNLMFGLPENAGLEVMPVWP